MYRLNIENFLKYTLVTVTKAFQEAAAVGGRFSQTFKKPLPSAGGFRRPSKSRCRWQEVFADLQKAAPVGRRFSQAFKKPLPLAGSFRRPSKGCCRWQEVFASLQKAAAVGRKSSSSDSDLTRLLFVLFIIKQMVAQCL